METTVFGINSAKDSNLLEDDALHQQEESVIDAVRTNLSQLAESEDLQVVIFLLILFC